MKQEPKEILETLLGTLGFPNEVEATQTESGLVLQVRTSEKEGLLAGEGELIDDLQFLVNRISQTQDAAAPKAYVDVEQYRATRNDRFLAEIRKYADLVRQNGRPFHLEPMNAYDRRLVHNAFKDDPEITTWSPDDDARIKRITLLRRGGTGGEEA